MKPTKHERQAWKLSQKLLQALADIEAFQGDPALVSDCIPDKPLPSMAGHYGVSERQMEAVLRSAKAALATDT